MSQPQFGKLMPNLDQQSTKLLNLTVLRRIDPFVEEILITAAHVAFYEFNIDLSQWSRKDVEGSLFVVKRNTQPRFQFIVMNRRNTDNLVENLLGDFEYEVQDKYLLYRNASQEINGIWFYDAHELEEVANLFSRILTAYSKVPQKSKAASTKGVCFASNLIQVCFLFCQFPSNNINHKCSEFEELEAVSTMAIMDGPLEPSSSTAPSVADVPDDPAFVNFFSVCIFLFNFCPLITCNTFHLSAEINEQALTAMTIGNASKTSNFGQPYQCSAAMPAPSNPPIVASPTVPALHLPYPLSSSTPLMPLLDTPESGSNHTNLVKPSTFFLHPSSSSQILPPVSTSSPTAPLLNPPLSLQRPHGAPLLQPFPPPAPSPSLTPAPIPTHNYGLTISREKVRDALLALIQDNQFIDMVHRALLNAHNS
ncbi:mRNA-decapping enzyme-like protein [Gossypium australe]|uniref:mRNA-decapping enzyme-like protein n=1 Tax=Gossypium australe TaxID=47621 RepID=A0A5B6VRU8_9ROSI|nr:mRNA-decapping enzyme-like protein [Gossypium australe]